MAVASSPPEFVSRVKEQNVDDIELMIARKKEAQKKERLDKENAVAFAPKDQNVDDIELKLARKKEEQAAERLNKRHSHEMHAEMQDRMQSMKKKAEKAEIRGSVFKQIGGAVRKSVTIARDALFGAVEQSGSQETQKPETPSAEQKPETPSAEQKPETTSAAPAQKPVKGSWRDAKAQKQKEKKKSGRFFNPEGNMNVVMPGSSNPIHAEMQERMRKAREQADQT